MAGKVPTHNLDHAIELYLAGKSVQEIRATTGVGTSVLFRERTRRGIPPRERSVGLPIDQIAARYSDGESVLSLAAEVGVSRPTLIKHLREAGVEIRGRSKAGRVRASRMTPAERAAQAAAAHAAVRGKSMDDLDKLRRALTRESKGGPQSGGEVDLANWLNERGENVTHQRAIGPYNVDLACLPVAVEVLGGGWHSINPKHLKRTPYILDAGWHLVMVWDYEGRSALGPGAADYLVTFLEEMRRNPSATSQYRVIAGDGELLAARSREDDEFPLEPPPRGLL